MAESREAILERLLAHAQCWLERPPEDATEEMAVGELLIRIRRVCSGQEELTGVG